MRVTVDQLRQLAPNAELSILRSLSESAHLLPDFGITTPLRLCHFLAQCAHESAGFRTVTEYASGAAYEGRADLGNVQPGDGVRFRGRGIIQTTGRHNYARFTAWARERFPDAPDFTIEPHNLGTFPWAILSALFYWQDRNINRHADVDDLDAVTRAVNGGLNGYVDRGEYLSRAKRIWGVDGASTEIGDTLRRGMAGNGVRRVQSALGIRTDGVFGPRTEAAVQAFQRANNLAPDGIVGPATWAALDRAAPIPPPPDPAPVAPPDEPTEPPPGGFFMRMWRALFG